MKSDLKTRAEKKNCFSRWHCVEFLRSCPFVSLALSTAHRTNTDGNDVICVSLTLSARCRMDLKKMCYPAILLEWLHLLVISLSQAEVESVEPSDPFMALTYAETVADNIAFFVAPTAGKATRGCSTVFWIWTIKWLFSSNKQLFSKSYLHSPNLSPLLGLGFGV